MLLVMLVMLLVLLVFFPFARLQRAARSGVWAEYPAARRQVPCQIQEDRRQRCTSTCTQSSPNRAQAATTGTKITNEMRVMAHQHAMAQIDAWLQRLWPIFHWRSRCVTANVQTCAVATLYKGNGPQAHQQPASTRATRVVLRCVEGQRVKNRPVYEHGLKNDAKSKMLSLSICVCLSRKTTVPTKSLTVIQKQSFGIGKNCVSQLHSGKKRCECSPRSV